jgi:hypothetical protein
MAILATNLVQKVQDKYVCNKCDYSTSRNSQYNRHLSTRKHIEKININNINKIELLVHTKKIEFKCDNCNKNYKDRSGLWKHSKKCIKEQINTDNKEDINLVEVLIKENMDFKNVILELVKSNAELQKQMLEVCKNSTTNINNNNNNNKTFNMQFFLNEQCKDAMNIMDFVDTFKLQFSDLENVGEVGYVEGISNIIIKKLNELDVYKRPIHCSDAKRETLYVKDKNVWEKENGNHDKLRLAIKHITKKNTDMLNPWFNKHPGSCDSDNYLNDIYLEMVMQAMGGRGGIEENENKIIKKIAKTVLIDKI